MHFKNKRKYKENERREESPRKKGTTDREIDANRSAGQQGERDKE